MAINIDIQNRIDSWLNGEYDEATKGQIKKLIDEGNEKELIDSFYKDLEFGTGGLRGIMGVGSNRINDYTIGRATQGLANYIIKECGKSNLSVALGFDSRHNSESFAQKTAEILSSNNIKVYIYDDIKPIALLSFAVRKFTCNAGIVITASHNPKEYNGYKVYWSDGGQVITPHDAKIIEEVLSIEPKDVKKGNTSLIETIGIEIENEYINELENYIINKDIIKKEHNIKIVYTPIHGSGYKVVPNALKSAGFTAVTSLHDVQAPDGSFPTVVSPNPEEAPALKMAMDKAKEISAELVMGTDPDCDRMGCAIREKNGEYKVLSGNQIGTIFAYYILSNMSEKNKLPKNPYIVKTIVTTELAKAVADSYNIKIYDTLTGFKWIAEKIENKKDSTYLFGFEESFGYLLNSNVRDKDAVSACVMMAEIAAYSKSKGISISEYLEAIYEQYGFFYEETISLTKKGSDGVQEIENIMTHYRTTKLENIEGTKVVKYYDYENQIEQDYISGSEKNIDLPKSNVIQYILEDGTKITVRPSGTEPKIKFYFEVCIKSQKSDRVSVLKDKVNTLKKFIKE